MALYLGSNKVSINKYIQESGGDGGDSTTGSSDDVKFIDYDGTILYSYSTSDFLALTELPANPTHTGLVPQGWNWSLADAKTHVNNYGKLTIGQMYTTTSGKTEIDIYFPSDYKRLTPCLSLGINGEVDIDWGDGSAHTIVTGSSITTQQKILHEYTYPGNYTILIDVTNGTACPLSINSNLSFFTGNISSSSYNNYVYSNGVQAIRIGNNFTIRTYSFGYCYSLSSITIPNGAMSTMPPYLFQYCYSLSSITIPNGVTQIGSNAFYYCYSLSSVSIPNEMTRIESSAFQYCYSLSSISLPSSITQIQKSAFSSCHSLSSINIPDEVTSLGISVFTSCYLLSSVNIPNEITSISPNLFSDCYSLSSISIPNGVTQIGSSAFSNCRSLSSINIPNGVIALGSSVFNGCYSLSSITIPTGITSIPATIFRYNYSLSIIIIPSGVTSIGNNAFQGCYGVKEYHLLRTTPPALASTTVFTNIPSDCIIYVPQGTLEAYQTATNWSNYASYMQEQPS